jgi:hypothetical protein
MCTLGGNALGESPKEQLELVKGTAQSLVGLINKGYEVVISQYTPDSLRHIQGMEKAGLVHVLLHNLILN